MKSTTRGTLAAVLTGVAAAAGVGAATPAAAAGAIPVPVPLDGAESSVGTQLPELAGEVPFLVPGAPEGPRYREGRLLPRNTVPQMPLDTALPGLTTKAPLPHVVGEGFEQAGLDAPATDLDARTPGLSTDAPVTAPETDRISLPELRDPELALLTPVLNTAPAADLGMRPV
jgi:hypothetical protein